MTASNQEIEVICAACRHGQLDFLKSLASASSLPPLMTLDRLHHFPFYYAAEKGNLEILKWFAHECGQVIDFSAEIRNVLAIIALKGYLEVAQWLLQDSGQPIDFTAGDNVFVRFAAWNNHPELVSWAVCDSGQLVDVTSQDNWTFQLACESGDLALVKWLATAHVHARKNPAWKNHAPPVVDATAHGNLAAVSAAEKGRCDVLKWLVEESNQPVNVATDHWAAVRYATQNGHFELVKWLLEDSYVAALKNPALVASDIPTQLLQTAISGHFVALDAAVNSQQPAIANWVLFDADIFGSCASSQVSFPKLEAVVSRPQLNLYALARYGIDTSEMTSTTELLRDLWQLPKKHEFQKVTEILDAAGVDRTFTARQQFYLNQGIRRGLENNFIQSYADLLKLLSSSTPTTSRRL